MPLNLDNAVGSFAYTPDLTVSGSDLDLRIDCTLPDYTPAADDCLICKDDLGSNREFIFSLQSTGKLILYWWQADTTFRMIEASAATGVTDSTRTWLRMTLDADNGSGGHVVAFWKSTNGTDWTQIGIDVNAGAFTTSLINLAAPLQIGQQGSNGNPLLGAVYSVQVRSVIDGTIIASPDFDAQVNGTRSFVDTQNNLWTVNDGTATLTSSVTQLLDKRELFEDQTSYTSGANGDFDLVSGTFYRRERGPNIGGTPYSAEIRGDNAYGEFTLIGTPTSGLHLSSWYRIKSFASDGTNGVTLIEVYDNTGGGNVVTSLRINKDGLFTLYFYNGSAEQVLSAAPLDTWFQLGVSHARGTTYTSKWYYRTIGGALAQLGTTGTGTSGNNPSTKVRVGAIATGGSTASNHIIARIGAVALYGMDVSATPAYPDLIDPVATPVTLYFSDSTGSPANSGLSAGAPKSTIAEFNLCSRYTGFLAEDSADIEDIVLNETVMQIGWNQYIVEFNDSAPIAHNVIPATMTQYNAGTYPNIWMIAATNIQGAVVWEDDKWMNKFTGANIAAVAATMNTNASGFGSFYSDGTTLYLVASDNSNPNSNGKVYTHSQNRFGALGSAVSAGAGGSAIIVVNSNGGLIKNLNASMLKTTLARGTDNDPYNAYAVQWDIGCTGTHELRDSNLGYWSKHGAGRTTPASNMTVIRTRVEYGPGSPYTGFGGQSADVDYAASGTGNRFEYYSCINPTNSGLLGSIGGIVDLSQQSWLTHGGSTTTFSGGGVMEDSIWCSGLQEQNDMLGATFTINHSSYYYLDPGNATYAIDNLGPTLASATLQADGVTIILLFTETAHAPLVFDGLSPAFTVTANSVSITITNFILIDDLEVHLTLDTILNDSMDVKFNYATSGTPITDAVSNPVAAITNYSVTNNSGIAGPSSVQQRLHVGVGVGI